MGTDAYRVVTLYLIVISAVDVPRYIISIFHLPVRWFLAGNPPWLIWACLPILWFNIDRASGVGRGRFTVDREDMFFGLVMMGWWYMSWAQGSLTGVGPYQRWMNLYLVTTNIWFYCYYFLLKTFNDRRGVQTYLADVTVNVVSWMSGAYLALYVLATFGPAWFGTLDIYQSNGVAFNALFGITVLFFFQDARARSRMQWWMLLTVNVTIIVLNQTRGALAVLLALGIWRLAAWGRVERKVGVLAVGVGVAMVAVNLLDLKVVVTLWRGLMFGLSAADLSVEESLLRFLPDELVSAYGRNAANVVHVREFLQHPLIGIGMDRVYAIRPGGFVSHTYYLFPLTAYGLVGTVLYAMYFVVWPVRAGFRLDRRATIGTLLFLFGTMTFLNDWRAWYAILFFLMIGDGKSQGVQTQGERAVIASKAAAA